jgi:hypothetical protein
MTRLMAVIRTFSTMVWEWLKPGGPWLGLRRFVAVLLVLAAFVTFGQTNSPFHALADWVTGSEPGQITLSQPLVYTRERLVDDRLEQINWLNQRLRALDREIEPAFQSTEGRIERSRALGAGLTTQAGASSNAPMGPAKPPLLETTMSRFQQMNLYREALRVERMRAILDDRHDIAGNTVFQLSFEATVLPSRSGKGAGIIALQIREDNEGKTEWKDLPRELRYEYERLYRDWISVLRRDFVIGIEGRTRALALDVPAGRIISEEGPAGVLRSLRVLVCAADWRVRSLDEGGFISKNEAIDDCEAWSRDGHLPPREGFSAFAKWFDDEAKKAREKFRAGSEKQYKKNMETALDHPQLRRVFLILDGDQAGEGTFRQRLERLTNYEAALRACENSSASATQFYIPFAPLEERRIIGSKDGDLIESLGGTPPSSTSSQARGETPQSSDRGQNQTPRPPQPQLMPLFFPCPARYLPAIEAALLLDLHRRAGAQDWGNFTYAFQVFPDEQHRSDSRVRKIQTDAPLCAAVYARYQTAHELALLPSLADAGRGQGLQGDNFRLSDFVHLTVAEPFPKDCQLQVQPTQRGAEKLYEFLQKRHRETFTYGLSPRNEMKRFETATEALLQARLTVPTASAGGLDADAWYSAVERAQGIQERISIAGFSHDKSFGWIFLPTRLGLEERHRLEMRTLQAILSLPAFWRRAHIKLARCWSHEGQFEAVRSLFHKDFFKLDDWEKKTLPQRAGCELTDFRMRIPGSEAEIERGLNLEILRTPYLNISQDEEMIAYEGRPASFRLSGGRLWRSTTVTLGGQPADRIRVLPDMRGIIAEFECVNHPSVLERSLPQGQSSMNANFEEVTTYLAIWTSEGTTERNRLPVKIRRARGAEPYLSCRDINPATQQRPAPPTLRSVPPPSPISGEVRN